MSTKPVGNADHVVLVLAAVQHVDPLDRLGEQRFDLARNPVVAFVRASAIWKIFASASSISTLASLPSGV